MAGRPPLGADLKKTNRTIRLAPATWARLDRLAAATGSIAEAVDRVLDQAAAAVARPMLNAMADGFAAELAAERAVYDQTRSAGVQTWRSLVYALSGGYEQTARDIYDVVKGCPIADALWVEHRRWDNAIRE